jgi:hypothetical protein
MKPKQRHQTSPLNTRIQSNTQTTSSNRTLIGHRLRRGGGVTAVAKPSDELVSEFY